MSTITAKKLNSTVVVADTDTELYVVPASTETRISSINVCNIGSTDRTFRVAIVDGAIGTVTNDDYLFYDAPINGNSSLAVQRGLAAAATYTILVRADHAEVVFSAYGTEKV
ncbi:MAG: hypothetical protein GY845_03375 [Planctomycetes bacterium]|nr:hypothetical protein [Planctomycetota bacterium]